MGLELMDFCSMRTVCMVEIQYGIQYRQPLVVDLLALQSLMVVLLMFGQAVSISLTVIKVKQNASFGILYCFNYKII